MDEIKKIHLNQTLSSLEGPSKELITVQNQWAAIGLDKYHENSCAEIEFELDGQNSKCLIEWDSNFPKSAMKENVDTANHGGVAIAWFVMSVIKKYKYVEQSEIGDGVDYRFKKNNPDDDDLNFLDDSHYVEVSGILQESKSNTLRRRVAIKHAQIKKGAKSSKRSSVIVTLFSAPKTIKEIHR